MKVGIVCPYDWSFPGGVRSHIVSLTGELRKKGVDVEVIAPASGDDAGIFVAGGSFGIPYNGSVARLCFTRSASARVKERVSAGDLDLIHVHEPGTPSVSMLALKHSTVPVVATFHASASRSRAYQVFRPVLRPLIDRISERVAVSEAALGLISTYFPGPYHVIPNGIDFDRFAETAPDEELLTLKPFVLFVGWPEARKGFPVIVEAMERVRKRLGLRLVAVGPTHREVPSWATGLGRVTDERLPRIFRATDLFCAPSLAGESFGIVLVEAMAAGAPVVCSDVAGYVEAAGGAAVHVPAGDVEATADGIIEVASNGSLRADLHQKGKQRAQQLDWSVLVDDILERYRSALGG